MDHNQRLSHLTSGELAYLWNTYEYETMVRCGFTIFLQHVDDEATKELLKETQTISTERIEQVKDILMEEKCPPPLGFTESDMNVNAPRLFSDNLYLEFMLQLIKMELPNYGLAFVEVTKPYLQRFYEKAIKDSMNIEKKVKQLAIDKGIYIPSPRIPTPKQRDIVTKDSFLSGWFGEKRPLLGLEISHLVFNAKRNGIGQAVITGFSQVAQAKEVRKFFERGREISGKTVEIFANILHDHYLPTSTMLWTSEVTDSTEAPFSDKLMMKMITTLIASGMSSYGSAMSMSARRDLGIKYARLLTEVAQFADDGVEIIIKHGWMEQPPIAADRKDLAK